MANLSFIYGTMEAGKTTELMQDAYNYRKHKHKITICKPGIDTKGENYIVNRQGEKLLVDMIISESATLKDLYYLYKDSEIILIDEAQFLNKNQIIELSLIAHLLDIRVQCYGLKSNFKGELFEGSSTLLSYADEKKEIVVICECGKIANFNGRSVNGKYTYEGEEVVIDGSKEAISYNPLCTECFIKKVLPSSLVKPYLEYYKESILNKRKDFKDIIDYIETKGYKVNGNINELCRILTK